MLDDPTILDSTFICPRYGERSVSRGKWKWIEPRGEESGWEKRWIEQGRRCEYGSLWDT